jgi:hypothetical protein
MTKLSDAGKLQRESVYVAGPMTGIPEYNFPAFHAATRVLRNLGHVVFNPAEMDTPEDIAQYQAGSAGAESETWRYFLARDLEIVLTKADAVVVLPGWRNSQGATLEVTTALTAGKPVYEYPTLKRLPLVTPLPTWVLEEGLHDPVSEGV